MSGTALVTGSSGWLGTRLVLGLTRGLPDVPALARPEPDLTVRCLAVSAEDEKRVRSASDAVEVCRGDLRDRTSLDRFCTGAQGATLYHCAGLVHPAWRAREFREINRDGTRALLEEAAAGGVRRAVVVSSNSPLGVNPNRDHRFDETSPYHPYMGYGRSKMEMEQVVAEIQAAGRLETVVVRAPWFYGPSQPRRQTEFFKLIRRGRWPIVGDGTNVRSMVYVDNLCQGLLLCARHEAASGKIYWIADQRAYTMNEIVDSIEALMEREFGLPVAHRRVRLPGLVSELAMVADRAIQACGLYQEHIHVLSELNKNIACSVARANRELGYAPAVELEEGMRRSLRWCLERGIEL